MSKSVVQDASVYACNMERRITRSMTKSDRELQGVVLGRKNQVIRKKCNTGKETQMLFLPEDVMFKIFLLLPAKVLHDVMRPICRLWRKIIRDPEFIKEHLLQSPKNSLFVVQDLSVYIDLYFISNDETTWNFTRKVDQMYLAHGAGLILTADRDDRSILYLLNPSTNQIVTLPQAPIKSFNFLENWAVAYSPSTSNYKVACVDFHSKRTYILTVSVDKEWREIVVEPDTKECKVFYDEHCSSVGIWGYIYWYRFYDKYKIVLDLEKEIFYKVNFQEVLGEATPISSDRILSMATEHDHNCWHFWELVDYKNGGEWQKLGSFDLESKLSEINKSIGLPSHTKFPFRFGPVVLKSRDEAIFRCRNYDLYMAYNFKTGKVGQLFHRVGRLDKLIFTNSLVVF